MTSIGDLTALLESGDLIFIRVDNFLYRRVAATSKSWESHVGILFENAPGVWTVAESRVPLSTRTSLARFIARSAHRRCAVRRVRGGLSPAEKGRLREASDRRMGKWYHLGFDYRSDLLFCSKFVHDVYLEATGREVGHLRTFRQLLTANPDAPLLFWQLWFFGRIPWDRETVTTTSQMESPELITVFDGNIA
jgi:Permuted papain-like amidase enzyme, YaeF/YiiX, C92 family